jgi:hypothetical protein
MWKEAINIRVNFPFVYALKAYDAAEVHLQPFLTSELNLVNGQLHVPTLGTGDCA